MKISRSIVSLIVVLSVVAIDQIVKILVKTHMFLYERIDVFSWFQIYFTENRGMAFGMNFLGTMFLAIFRVIAIALFCFLLYKQIQRKAPMGLIVCLAFIIAGALGNIIDNCFYGLVFTESPDIMSTLCVPAEFTAFGEGYGTFLTGRVVDMFYFPLFTWPQWMPFVGGDIFFGAVFNVADAAISCASVVLLLFYSRSVFSHSA